MLTTLGLVYNYVAPPVVLASWLSVAADVVVVAAAWSLQAMPAVDSPLAKPVR